MPSFFVIYWNAESTEYQAVNGPESNKTFDAVDGTDANAAACLQIDRNGKFVAFSTGGPNPATYQTAYETPLNSNLVFTAWVAGVAGNNIRIRYVVAGNNTPLSVSVVGNDITVNLATNGSGVPTSTAGLVRSAIENSVTASDMIDTTYPQGEDGLGIIPSGFGFVNLQYGSTGAAVATIVEQVESTSSSPTTF